MRVQEWVVVNADSLVSVDVSDVSVTLQYTHDVVNELRRLVDAEQDCCGAAGVLFELDEVQSLVTVTATKVGLPSRTVLAALLSSLSP